MVTKKWLARVGALLIMMGFVLPSLTVSCASLPESNQSVSLLDLASASGDVSAPVLYMIPMGALMTLIFAFLSERPNLPKSVLFFGQATGAVVGILSILFTLLLYSRDYGRYGFDISPQFGINVLAIGYALVAAGLVFQLPDLAPTESSPIVMQSQTPPATPQQPSYAPRETNQPYISPQGKSPSIAHHLSSPAAGPRNDPVLPPVSVAEIYETPAWLRVIQGDIQQTIVPLDKDHFTIGRSSSCHLRLFDRSISRQHARLRFANGTWYLQDQGSAAGTLVNGVRVNATRLNPGDIITIGDCQFEFNMQ